MDVSVFPGMTEAMSQGDLVTHLQATCTCRFRADDKLIRTSESPAVFERPRDAVHRLKCSEEVAVGCDHRDTLVGISHLRRHRPGPGEACDDLLVLLH